jgi:hypothetical protein
LVILVQAQLCMRIGQQTTYSTAKPGEERGKALTLRTRAIVLELLCSTYPNSSVNESLSKTTVDFIFLLRFNNGLIGSSLSAVPSDWVSWFGRVSSAWRFSAMGACEACN